MAAYIHQLATAVPSTFAAQDEVRDILKSRYPNDRKTSAILHRIYTQSGIEKRHTVLSDFHEKHDETFFNRAFSDNEQPGTGERNQKYQSDSVDLFLRTGRALIENQTQFSAKDITHVITISCTGFFAPGPDYEVVKGLNLRPDTHRFHIGFMGCYAAFQGLKMAKSFCENDEHAVVLVIAAELCSLHFQNETDPDNLIAASVFADGAAGALISSGKPTETGLELGHFATSIAYEGEKDMAWTIGDHGFNMILSSYVPDIISSNLQSVLEPVFKELDIGVADIDRWAIHPGGRAIVDKVLDSMELNENQVASSRAILRDYGNMSSATVLFVLKHILDSKPVAGEKIVPMAFGPGLTIETGLLTVSGA